MSTTLPGLDPEFDRDLAALEEKLATLVAHIRALRAANEALRRDLATANERNYALAERVVAAKQRLETLLTRLPEPTAQ